MELVYGTTGVVITGYPAYAHFKIILYLFIVHGDLSAVIIKLFKDHAAVLLFFFHEQSLIIIVKDHMIHVIPFGPESYGHQRVGHGLCGDKIFV